MATPDFIDGFEWATTGTILAKWTTGSISSVQTGRFSYGQCVRMSGVTLYKSLSTNFATVGAAAAIRINTLNPAPLLGFRLSGSIQCDLRMLADGRMTITRNGTVVATSAAALMTGVWYHLEFALYVHDSIGTAEVRINEVSFVSFSGDTQATTAENSGYANEFFLLGAGSLQVDFDDVCVYSGAGWLGDCRIYSLLPSGAGNYSQWTPSAGSNYACVDETAPNSDTDYVSETNPGDIDTYAFGDISGSSATIQAVAVNMFARKDDAGARTICPVYRRSSTDTLGDNISLANGYLWYAKIWQADPLTAAAWTLANLNGSEFGVKLVS